MQVNFGAYQSPQAYVPIWLVLPEAKQHKLKKF